MKYLYGLHDPGGEHLFADAKGWIVFTESIGHDPNDQLGRDYRQWSDAGYGVLVRLNNGYGSAGTIPTSDQYGRFAVRVANFIANSKGCDTWIIGNEPNHSQERPNGETIRAAHYINCFKVVHQEVRAQNGARHALIPAPVAPWNMEGGDWLEYHKAIWRDLWQLAGGVAIHAYTHGPSPALITSEERVQGWHWHFRTYRDQLAALPGQARGLPVYITESNQGDNAWVDANTGWVQAAYDEIDRWNQQSGNQKIYCLCLYRWPAYDRWGIVDKPGVHQDLRAAIGRGFSSPAGNINVMPQTPSTSTNTQAAPALPREWDERLTQRGVTVETPPLQPGQRYWRVKSARWYDEQEADALGPDHHLMLDVLDIHGQRMLHMPLRISWPSDSTIVHIEAKPGEPYGQGYGLPASRNEFSVQVEDDTPSEIVRGIGMGADTPGGFNSGIHTSTGIVFERALAPAVTSPTQTHIPVVTKPVDSTPQPSDTWARCRAFVKRWEGNYQNVENDSGNWTGGAVGVGELKGTKYGISAASYPHLDIRNLTIEQADEIYYRDYWQASGADKLPWPACLIVFDTAVLHGVGTARVWQKEVGTNALAIAAKRLRVYTRMDNWHYWGAGWTNRVADLLEVAAQ